MSLKEKQIIHNVRACYRSNIFGFFSAFNLLGDEAGKIIEGKGEGGEGERLSALTMAFDEMMSLNGNKESNEINMVLKGMMVSAARMKRNGEIDSKSLFEAGVVFSKYGKDPFVFFDLITN